MKKNISKYNAYKEFISQIIKADPTSIEDKPGKCTEWLMMLFHKKALTRDMLPIANDILYKFDMYHNKM